MIDWKTLPIKDVDKYIHKLEEELNAYKDVRQDLLFAKEGLEKRNSKLEVVAETGKPYIDYLQNPMAQVKRMAWLKMQWGKALADLEAHDESK